MSLSSINNQTNQIVDNKSIRSSVLEIASATGALCALATDPFFLFLSHDTAFIIDVPSTIATSLLDISAKVIEKLLDICKELDLVLARCIVQKLAINNSKYPVALCKVRSIFVYTYIRIPFHFM
jgi:hypothetical protein